MPPCAQRWPSEPVDVIVQQADDAAQEDPDCRHGFDHDRPGMHRRAGRRNRHQGRRSPRITARSMNGEIAFEPALRERVALLEGPRHAGGRPHHRQRASRWPRGGRRAGAHHAQPMAPGRHWSPAASTSSPSRIAAMLGFQENRANRLLEQDGRSDRRWSPSRSSAAPPRPTR